MLKPETIHVLVGRLVLENLSLQDEVVELQKSLGLLKGLVGLPLVPSSPPEAPLTGRGVPEVSAVSQSSVS